MCDVLCDVIICCVWSWSTGKINLCDEVVVKNQKKRKYGNFYLHLHL